MADAPASAGGADLVLVVDDDEVGRYARVRVLRRAGYEVIDAATGGDGLRLAGERRPALVVLDVKLPDINGIEVCKAIKRDHAGMMVLQTSASFVTSEDRVRGLEGGADNYLTQPVDPRELVAAVRALLRLQAAEQALRRLNEILEQRVAEEVAERSKAEEALRQSQKMEAIGQLTGGLAHDFNNLLTGVTGSLEMLQVRIAQGRVGDVDRYVNAAQGAAKRAAALTHRLLAFSRRQTLDPKPTDLNRLVAGMEELVRRTVGPEVAVEVVAAGGLWTTLVDPGQLENALLNLCINARDAMPDGGRITVETANRWLDGRAARDRDYSEEGRGTMVCLYLPRHLGVDDAVEAPPELAEEPRARQGETVLVVDDEPTVRMLVADVLEELGYTALEAADGASGLKVLRSDARIDLLVTDVGLPGGMNGRQVADAARAVRPGLKVLFITGYAENAVLSHGHLDPGMHVLTKPFAMAALASRITELIAGK